MVCVLDVLQSLYSLTEQWLHSYRRIRLCLQKLFADNECSCTNDQQQSQYIEDVMGLFLVFELCENNCQERVDSIVSTLKERYSHTLSSASDLIEEREQLLRQLMKYQLEAKSNSSSLPYLTPICTYIQHSFWDPIQAYKY